MAPQTRNPAVGLISNGASGAQESSEPPPSTLAANLVNNLSARRNSVTAEVPEDFQRLLLEVAETGEAEYGEENLDVKLQHHHKLIYVVAKAVLEPLTQDNPFANTGHQIQQASEAIDILIATIKETPEVLLHVSSAQDCFRVGSPIPLWIWLIPKLLTLLGREGCDALKDKIQEFIHVSITSASRSVRLWGLNVSIFSYLRHCVDGMSCHSFCFFASLVIADTLVGILDLLQESKAASYSQSSPLYVTLPPVKIDEHIALSWISDLHTNECTYVLNGWPSIKKHTLLLLSLLLEACTVVGSSHDSTPAFGVYLIWILESILLLNRAGKFWALGQANLEYIPDTVILIRTLLSFLSCQRNLLNATARCKSYRVLAVLCIEILEHPGAVSDLLVQSLFSDALEELMLFTENDDFVYKAVHLRILPSLAEFANLANATGSFNNESQVGIPLIP